MFDGGGVTDKAEKRERFMALAELVGVLPTSVLAVSAPEPRPGHPGGGRAARRRGERRLSRALGLWRRAGVVDETPRGRRNQLATAASLRGMLGVGF